MCPFTLDNYVNVQEGQNCGCDHTKIEPPTCIARCIKGFECLEPFKGTCTRVPGDNDN